MNLNRILGILIFILFLFFLPELIAILGSLIVFIILALVFLFLGFYIYLNFIVPARKNITETNEEKDDKVIDVDYNVKEVNE